VNTATFSLPVFVSGIVLVIAFSLWLGWLPPSGYVPFLEDPARHIRHLAMPALAIGINFIGVTARITQTAMSQEIGADYVSLARSKGSSKTRTTYVHSLPNALPPVISILGVRAGSLLGGTVIIEALFAWPGLSSMLLTALQERDYPVVQGALFVIFAMFVAMSLLVDILHGIVDPRVRRAL
jgi:peptide/nickel transport system permease protein